jgi:hypothetical protein
MGFEPMTNHKIIPTNPRFFQKPFPNSHPKSILKIKSSFRKMAKIIITV